MDWIVLTTVMIQRSFWSGQLWLILELVGPNVCHHWHFEHYFDTISNTTLVFWLRIQIKVTISGIICGQIKLRLRFKTVQILPE